MNQEASTPRGPVKSPCVRICKIDDADGKCLGCCRTPEEIRGWFQIGDAQKLAIVADIPNRMRERIARRRRERDADAIGS